MIREADIEETLDVPVEEWGVDYEGPIPEDLISTVEVPETSCPLNEHDLQQFLDAIDTDTRFEDLGIEHYVHCKESLLCHCLSNTFVIISIVVLY